MGSNLQMRKLLLWKSLKIGKKRTLNIIFSVTLSTALVASLCNVYFDIKKKMGEELQTFGPNFFIAPSKGSSGDSISEKDIKKILTILPHESIRGLSPFLIGPVRLKVGSTILVGAKMTELRKLSDYWQVEGRWPSVDFDNRQCMVGSNLASKMHYNVGDEIELFSSTSEEAYRLKIKGIMETGSEIDEQIFVNFDLAQKILNLHNQAHYIKLRLPFDFPGVSNLIQTINKSIEGIDAVPIRRLAYSEGKIIEKIKTLMAIVVAVIMTITMFSIMVNLSAIVLERKAEIALLKALGARNFEVIQLFLTEALVLTLIGGLGGVVLSHFVSQVIGQSVFSSPISFRFLAVALTFTLTILVNLLACYWPLKAISRIHPAKVLKGE